MVQALPAGLAVAASAADEEWEGAMADGVDAAEPAEVREAEVRADAHGQRLDRWLVGLAPEFSRNHLQHLVERGCVTVAGLPPWMVRTRSASGFLSRRTLSVQPCARVFLKSKRRLRTGTKKGNSSSRPWRSRSSLRSLILTLP